MATLRAPPTPTSTWCCTAGHEVTGHGVDGRLPSSVEGTAYSVIAEGLNNAAIARRLCITEKTVVVHTPASTTRSAFLWTATSTAGSWPSSATSVADVEVYACV